MSNRNSILEISDKLALKAAINTLIHDLGLVKEKCTDLMNDENCSEEDKVACETILKDYDGHLEDLQDQMESVYLTRGEEQFKVALNRFADTAQAITDLISDNLGASNDEENSER